MPLQKSIGRMVTFRIIKQGNMKNTLGFMGFKSICLTIATLLYSSLFCEGQDFGCSYGIMSREDRLYRDFKRSILVVDNGGNQQLKAEPIYEDVRYENNCDFAAVSIPIRSIDSTNQRYSNDQIWLCLDRELKPVFLFPIGTEDVQIDTTLQMFLYTDLTSVFSRHWYRKGVIDYSGKVILKPRFSNIYKVGNCIMALEECLDSALVVDRRIVFKEMYNEKENAYIIKDIWPFSMYEDVSQIETFEKAWENILNGDFYGAKELFQQSSNGTDCYIREASKYNIKSIKTIIRKERRMIRAVK